MDLQLRGKRALVTGSSAGIGAATARLLAAEGALAVVHGLHADRADQVAEEIRRVGGQAVACSGDLGADEGAGRVAEAALAAFGGIDILVNNAGQYPEQGWWDSEPGQWATVYDTDVLSTLRMVQHLVPPMRGRGWGRVIQMSSASAERVPSNRYPLYATAKAAQTHMTRSLAAELTGSGITVNAVAPGPVATDTLRKGLAEAEAKAGRPSDWPAVERRFVDTVMNDPPVPRMASAEEVAALVAFLASPLADPITGSVYVIDSGFSLTGFRRQPSAPPTAARQDAA